MSFKKFLKVEKADAALIGLGQGWARPQQVVQVFVATDQELRV